MPAIPTAVPQLGHLAKGMFPSQNTAPVTPQTCHTKWGPSEFSEPDEDLRLTVLAAPAPQTCCPQTGRTNRTRGLHRAAAEGKMGPSDGDTLTRQPAGWPTALCLGFPTPQGCCPLSSTEPHLPHEVVQEDEVPGPPPAPETGVRADTPPWQLPGLGTREPRPRRGWGDGCK